MTISHAKLKSTALEQKRFDLQLLSPALHNLWLLLVLKHTVFPTIFLTLISGSQLVWKFRHQTPSVYLCSDIPLTVTSAFYQGPAGPDGIAGKDGEQVRNAVLLYYPPLIARTFTCDESWIKDEKGSRSVPINPSPKPTLTLTSRLGQNVGLREGQVGSFPETYNTWSLFFSLSSVTVPDVFAKAHSTQMSFRKFTRSSSFLVSKVAKFNNYILHDQISFFFPQGDPGAIGKYGPVGFTGDRVSYLTVCFPLLCFLVLHGWRCTNHSTDYTD